MATFAEMVAARGGDEGVGLRFEGAAWSWRRVVEEGRRRAALIGRLAPSEPGRAVHVGVLLENVPEYVFWLVGAALRGAVVVGVNPTRRGAELAADIAHTDCDVLVTDATGLDVLPESHRPGGRVLPTESGLAKRPASGPEPTQPGGAGAWAVAARGGGPPVVLVDSAAYARAVAEAEPWDGSLPDAGARYLLLFTSGSTGAPKAVSCSQGRLAVIAEMAEGFGLARESVTYVAMPLCHGNSIMANLAMAVRVGATVVLRRRFSASGFLPDVRRYGVTYFNYVGRALAYVLAAGAADPGCTLARVFGTEASARDRAAFAERFGCAVVEGYGSSEGAIAIRRTPETPPDALGVAQHGVEILVLDPDTGKECPRAVLDASGRLHNPEAIGEMVGLTTAFEGYYNNPEADAERLREGRYHSGDLAYRDEEGFFYFAGRTPDRLRVDGENFAAAPVERILARWAPVVMCAVYPVPDPRTGDQVMASLELDGTPFDPAAFTAFLAAQEDLGTKWAPKYVRIVSAMPLTATTKVDKKPLRAQAWRTDDPVWHRPGRDLRYLPFTDPEGVEAEFVTYGRHPGQG
ncbi:AMP-binding protein [Actinocorallia sp. API 0066]|uniref:AMP-binding protein n=1 Tax=Actinocorallia sp. API 0066 TaxID=2896846 RepID=UPI001E370764|nr:AMP-binding protein [Actinocorallia sp. API 0066]MCD0451046.1 AMP-binding protein [Actinocorallia sp. API 0066]